MLYQTENYLSYAQVLTEYSQMEDHYPQEQARKYLEPLTMSNLTQLRSYSNPPQRVFQTLEFIGILATGGDDSVLTWQKCKALVSKITFLQQLYNMKASEISEGKRKKLKKIVEIYKFDDNAVRNNVRNISFGAYGLLMWGLTISELN